MSETAEEFLSSIERLPQQIAAGIPRLLEEARELIIADIRQNFGTESAADGTSWPLRKDDGPLGDKSNWPLLHDTGALLAAATAAGPGSIDRVVDGDTIEIGVDAEVDLGGIRGARAHNFGYPPGNLPQREWAGVRETTVDLLAQQAEEFVVGLIVGASR